MTIYPEYPAAFPCPTWAYRDVQESMARRAQFECGWARQRRQWPDFDTDLDFSFIMETDLYDNWSRWVQANGHDWFWIEINPGQPVVMRLTGAVQAAYSDSDRIAATAAGEFQNG